MCSRKVSACLAGDSAAYQRTSLYGDDVVIVAAQRTALCKAKRGSFKDTYPDELLASVLRVCLSLFFNSVLLPSLFYNVVAFFVGRR
ncbi:hypothetical protein HID58_031262 [Brassica napus]|uniref:Uncharacterized protein n=1 Tax=Brassica napus TaxID=3708 RepID=A0ABQ8CIA6_BRANA|nr:hypothetical protein HID58_031262 [Brassica napus]